MVKNYSKNMQVKSYKSFFYNNDNENKQKLY